MRSHPTALPLLVLLIGLCPCGTAAFGSWLPNGNPVRQPSHNEDWPRVAPDGAGGAFVVWRTGGLAEVQHFLPSGDVAEGWPLQGRHPGAEAKPKSQWDEHFPRLIKDDRGGFFALWQPKGDGCDISCGSDPTRLWVQHRTADGELAPGWPATGLTVSERRVGPRSEPPAIADDAGGLFVAWIDVEYVDPAGSQTQFMIDIQRIGPDGQRLWGNDGIRLRRRVGPPSMPVLVSDGTGGVFAFWTEPTDEGLSQIVGQRVSREGKPFWNSPRAISERYRIPGVEPFYRPIHSFAAVSDGSQGAIVTWIGARQGGDLDVHAARVTHGGSLPWHADLPVCTATGDQIDINLVPSNDGGAWIGWRDRRRDSGYDVYAQRITRGGRMLGPSTGIPVCVTDHATDLLKMAADGTGGAFIAWQDGRPEGMVFATRLVEAGTPASGWRPNGEPICARTVSEIYAMSLEAIDRGRALIVWQPELASFTTLLTPNGPASAIEGVMASAPPPVSAVSRIGEVLHLQAPFWNGGRLVARFSLSSHAPARLEAFDIAGRRIAARSLDLDRGNHQVELDVVGGSRGSMIWIRLTQGTTSARSRIMIP